MLAYIVYIHLYLVSAIHIKLDENNKCCCINLFYFILGYTLF